MMSVSLSFSQSQCVQIVAVVACFLIQFSTAGEILCPRLLPKKGVDLQCSYMNPNKTEITRSCSLRSSPDTIAKYNCKSYFNPSSREEDESKFSRRGGEMKCTRKGKWRNVAHFRKFKCHLSASGWINQVIDTNRVVIFSLSYCGYCHKIKQIFQTLKIKYFAIELDLVDERKATLLKQALSRKTGMRTYPNVWVHRKHLGGYDNTYAAYYYGTLQTLLDSPLPPINH